MSSLWTPSGEHPVEPEGSQAPPAGPPASGPVASGEAEEARAEAEAEVEALRQRLAETPAETVIANHCYGLFELGAIYLSSTPPLLPQARLAIDAFGYLVEGLGERLGDAVKPLRDALAQLRLGYVQLDRATESPRPEGGEGA
jgi:hypothetical protein